MGTPRLNARGLNVPAATIASAAALAGCSDSGYRVDRGSCAGWGATVWDRCWWYEKSWVLGFGLTALVYGIGWSYLWRRQQKNETGCSIFLYYLVGVPIALFAGMGLTMFIESLLTKG